MVVARPVHKDGHAIVQASFGVEVASQPPSSTIRELLALHPKLEERYPRRRETKGRTFSIQANEFDVEDPRLQFSDTVLTGFTLDSLKSNGEIERAVTLSERVLSVTRTDYDSWEKIWGEVRQIFALMLPVLLQRANTTAFHLQYHNRFVWEGEVGAFRSEMVFRRDSQYLTPNAFAVPDLWHSNHGFFEYPDQPSKHQLLRSADAQVVLPDRVGADPNLGLIADVKLNHRAIHGVERAGAPAKPIATVEEVLGGGNGGGLLDRYMEDMHANNKWLLARLINDEMCDKIQLFRPE